MQTTTVHRALRFRYDKNDGQKSVAHPILYDFGGGEIVFSYFRTRRAARLELIIYRWVEAAFLLAREMDN